MDLRNLKSKNKQEKQFALAMIFITVMMSYVCGFTVGLGPIPFVVVSLILHQEPLAVAMSLSLAFNSNFGPMLSFCFIQDDVHFQIFVLFVFGVIPFLRDVNVQLLVLLAIGVIPRLDNTCVMPVEETVDESLLSLREENKQLRQRIYCIRCQLRIRCVIYIPCGHLLYCSDCDMLLHLRHCPMCNNPIRGWREVFLS